MVAPDEVSDCRVKTATVIVHVYVDDARQCSLRRCAKLGRRRRCRLQFYLDGNQNERDIGKRDDFVNHERVTRWQGK